MDPKSRNAKLLQLGALIQSAIAEIVTLNGAKEEEFEVLPAKPLFNAQRTLLSAAGLLTELASEPSNRLLEVGSQYFEARCLHIAAEKRIADIVSDRHEGVPVLEIADIAGADARKLSRILRCLCSIHIFKEVQPDCFANNDVSAALVHNEPLRAYIVMFGLDLYSASDYLPKALFDPAIGKSYDVANTAWQCSMRTPKSRWEWLDEKTTAADLKHGTFGLNGNRSAYPGPFGTELDKALDNGKDGQQLARPEHAIFGLAMLGGGKVFGEAHLYDYPWESLGSALIVDVGGGVGGFCLQLAQLYPNLRFIVQDRAAVLQQAKTIVWPKENPHAVEDGRVRFVAHDFFLENPIKDADVYWLRYVVHNWSDEACVRILSGLKKSMGLQSRVLICDQVMNTTLGTPELHAAPYPLPANWGYYTRYSHQRDMSMMTNINGIERTPSEFKAIIEEAGLKLHKIWDCRSQVSLVEAVLPGAKVSEIAAKAINGVSETNGIH
ncbi:MAG: hypothetical protein M1822_001224 [Bathelium mastoideum]|nr:MAG: hypothetical protein M1822_001224 [Bathelium mastoideum]